VDRRPSCAASVPKPAKLRPYRGAEGPKLGFYLISDGSPNPYRYRVRPPSLFNLTVLEVICLGHNVGDIIIILGSVGHCAGGGGR